MPILVAIDPGNLQSGLCLLDPSGPRVLRTELLANRELQTLLDTFDPHNVLVAIEGIESYGMAVGREVFDTAIWIGRLLQQADMRGMVTLMVYRTEIKLALCQNRRAKDPEIRTRILDLFGGATIAKGTKKNPGPLYGVSGHGWSALALALVAWEQQAWGSLARPLITPVEF